MGGTIMRSMDHGMNPTPARLRTLVKETSERLLKLFKRAWKRKIDHLDVERGESKPPNRTKPTKTRLKSVFVCVTILALLGFAALELMARPMTGTKTTLFGRRLGNVSAVKSKLHYLVCTTEPRYAQPPHALPNEGGATMSNSDAEGERTFSFQIPRAGIQQWTLEVSAGSTAFIGVSRAVWGNGNCSSVSYFQVGYPNCKNYVHFFDEVYVTNLRGEGGIVIVRVDFVEKTIVFYTDAMVAFAKGVSIDKPDDLNRPAFADESALPWISIDPALVADESESALPWISIDPGTASVTLTELTSDVPSVI